MSLGTKGFGLNIFLGNPFAEIIINGKNKNEHKIYSQCDDEFAFYVRIGSILYNTVVARIDKESDHVIILALDESKNVSKITDGTSLEIVRKNQLKITLHRFKEFSYNKDIYNFMFKRWAKQNPQLFNFSVKIKLSNNVFNEKKPYYRWREHYNDNRIFSIRQN